MALVFLRAVYSGGLDSWLAVLGNSFMRPAECRVAYIQASRALESPPGPAPAVKRDMHQAAEWVLADNRAMLARVRPAWELEGVTAPGLQDLEVPAVPTHLQQTYILIPHPRYARSKDQSRWVAMHHGMTIMPLCMAQLLRSSSPLRAAL